MPWRCPNPDCGKAVPSVYVPGRTTTDPVKLRRHMMNTKPRRKCPESEQDHDPAALTWVAPPSPSAIEQEQLSGVLATWDGVCAYPCNTPIMRGDRITRRGEGWAHVRCHQEVHE